MLHTDPKAETKINPDIVKALVAAQFPAYAELDIALLDSGWDNENYRLGPELIIRLPRRLSSSLLILNEINWLPKIKDDLPIKIPAPIGVGRPDKSYPWHWSIIPWFEGVTADQNSLDGSEVHRLINFLKKLHSQHPQHAPENPYRGVPLSTKHTDVEKRMRSLKSKTKLITSSIEQHWMEAVHEGEAGEKYLIHGDLHPRNIIVQRGKIEAVIDWGDITAGDPANDLACVWMLFESDEICREAFNLYGASEGLIKRSIGWAIFFGVMLLDTGLNSNRRHARIGEFILRNLHQKLDKAAGNERA